MQIPEQKLLRATDPPRLLICEYFILGFALWTVASHMTVLIRGNLLNLLLIFASTSSLLLFVAWIRRKKQKPKSAISLAVPTEELETREQRMQNALLWILVIIAVFMTLVAHRPDADDTRYVNRAVAVADDPNAPILQYDTRHSIPDVPLNPTSKLISNEMLAGALSLLTGLPAIYIFHFVFAPLAAILTILAFGELFRILAPKQWAFGVLATVVFLCANGEVHRTFGNFSFVRLHQGKGILVVIIVPLIIVYSQRFVSHPTVRNWLLLAGSQIAAVGMNATGLMIAPTVALLSVLTGILGMNAVTGVKRVVLSLAASAYVVGVGLYTKLPMMRFYVNLDRYPALKRAMSSVRQQDISFWDRSIAYVFGDGRFAIFCLIIILTAWFWCETRLARRICLIFPIAVGLLFANPLIDDVVMKYITGKEVYWRVFWLLPLPVIAGIALLAPLTSPKLRLRSMRWRYGIFFLLLVLLLGVVSERSLFSKENYVRIGVPGLKVTAEYQIAQAINNAVDDRPNVLVPESVSVWLPTMHHHPYPLVSRFIYQYKLSNQRQERVMLTRYIMGLERPDKAPQVLHNGIQRYRISAVCVPVFNRWADEIRQVLGEEGFEKRQLLLSHEIWLLKTRRG